MGAGIGGSTSTIGSGAGLRGGSMFAGGSFSEREDRIISPLQTGQVSNASG
jgi:hypothetical protein